MRIKTIKVVSLLIIGIFDLIHNAGPSFAISEVNLEQLKSLYRPCSNTDTTLDNCFGEWADSSTDANQTRIGVFKGGSLWSGNIYERERLSGVCYEGACEFEPQCEFSESTKKYSCINGDVFWGYTLDSSNRIQGTGVYVWANGNKYQGDMKDNLQSGYGIESYVDRGLYRGFFKNNLRNGRGVYQFSDGGVYDGEFVDGLIQGYGVYVYPNGAKYEGNFLNNSFEGRGTLLAVNGDRYEGDFKEGKYSGVGTLYLKNGDRYVGGFLNDKFDGMGTYYFADGKRHDGKWQNGELLND